MKRSILLIVLALVACSPEIRPAITKEVPTLLPTETAEVLAVSAVPTVVTVQVPTVGIIRAVVNVRAQPDNGSASVGYLEAGDHVVILDCAGPWCRIEDPAGYVWRGCLSDNPDGLKCEAKP